MKIRSTLNGAILIFFLSIGLSDAAIVSVLGHYQLGEDDPGAVIGNPLNIVTVDSAGTQDLDRHDGSSGAMPIYSAGFAPGSAFSATTTGDSAIASKAGFSFPVVDNFALEGFFKINDLTGDTLFYNGDTSNNGFGFLHNRGNGNPAGVKTYQGLFGGTAFLNTGVETNVGDMIYLAMVRDAGATTIYVQDLNGSNPLLDFSFGSTPDFPGGPVEFFSIRSTGISADDVRLFTFDPGGFETSDLLVSQVPVPAAVWLFGSALGLLGWMRRKAA
jgi:hypothetical protein